LFGIGTSLRRSSARLPNPEALTNFFEQLRASQYRLDPRQLAAAHRILLSAHAENWAIERLRFVLMILLAKTRQEQSDFDGQFDRWLGIIKESRPTGLATWLARRSRAGLITLIVMLAAVSGFLAMRAWYIGAPSRTIPTGDVIMRQLDVKLITRAVEAVSSLGLADMLRAGAVVPLALFAAFMLLRRRRRALWLAARAKGETIEFDQLESAPALGSVFGGSAVYEIARELRRHRPVPVLELDIDRTVEATARQAGHFSAVWRQRVRRPEYVVLIEENSYRDHIARILDAGMDALKKLEVTIQRFYYNSDPRVVVADDRQRTPIRLAALAERGRHARLIIFGSGRGLVNPLTDKLGARLRYALQPWMERTFLSTEPVATWGSREHQLLRDGFSLGTASTAGLIAVATRVAQGTQGGALLEPRLKISYAPLVSLESGARGREAFIAPTEAVEERRGPEARQRFKPQADSLLAPSLVLFSTAASVEAGVFSLSAAIEVILAITIYWTIAIYLETQAHLWASVIIAPLLLLRSDTSVALALRWFEQYVHTGFGGSAATAIRDFQVWSATAVAAIIVPLATILLAQLMLQGPVSWITPASAFIVAYLAAQVGTAIVLGIAANQFPALCEWRWLTLAMAAAAVLSVTTGVALAGIKTLPAVLVIVSISGLAIAGVQGAPIATAVINRSRLSAEAETRGVTVALGLVRQAPHLLAIFAPGAFVGAWVRSLAIRFAATARHPLHGLRALPDNWWKAVFVVDFRHPPELIPGYNRSDLLQPSFLLSEARNAEKFLVRYVYILAFTVLFAPAYLYRLTIKSTCWAYLPLVYFMRPLRFADNPTTVLDRILMDPKEWARWMVLAATIMGLIAGNFDVAKQLLYLPVLSPLEFMFVIEVTNVKTWQWFLLAEGVITVVVMLRAKALKSSLRYKLIAGPEAEIDWRRPASHIEYLIRVRNIVTWIGIVPIILHALTSLVRHSIS
jgi:hypothetical protein